MYDVDKITCESCGAKPKSSDKVQILCQACERRHLVTLDILERYQKAKEKQLDIKGIKCSFCGNELDLKQIRWKCQACEHTDKKEIVVQKPSLPGQNVPMKIRCPRCGEKLSEREAFCFKCGQKIKPSAKIKPRFSKKSKIVILIASIAVVICAGLFTWCMFQSGWSFEQLQKIVTGQHFECFIKHDYLPANCMHGELCERCNYEIGEKTAHVWKEATCTKPKICDVCQLEEGEALGHSVGIGTCSVCGEYSTELQSEYDEISKNLNRAIKEEGDAVVSLSKSVNNYYDYSLSSLYVSNAHNAFSNVKEYLEKAVDICGTHPEFSEVKEKMENALSAIDTMSYSAYSLAVSGKTCVEYCDEAYVLMKKIK